VVGAIVGAGLINGAAAFSPLMKIGLSWLLAPVASALIAFLVLKVLAWFPNALPARLLARDLVVQMGLVAATCYSAFSLGANNVANVTGVYVSSGLISPMWAAVIGSASIGLGVITFSRRVIRTVGNQLVVLDPPTALVVILATAGALNVFALVGVPVSASQAVVGAVVGVGLAKGVRTVNGRKLLGIMAGWIGTPAVAGALSSGGVALAHVLSGSI
jgi:PiT family inorganic phosphate transporter